MNFMKIVRQFWEYYKYNLKKFQGTKNFQEDFEET